MLHATGRYKLLTGRAFIAVKIITVILLLVVPAILLEFAVFAARFAAKNL